MINPLERESKDSTQGGRASQTPYGSILPVPLPTDYLLQNSVHTHFGCEDLTPGVTALGNTIIKEAIKGQ